jgi:hypothetical protein
MFQITVNMYLRKLHLAIGALLIESNLALCAQSVQRGQANAKLFSSFCS